MAQLIEMNFDLVERATLVIRSAIANAMDWGDIELLVKDARARGDPVAMAIHSLKLKSNEITLLLRCVCVRVCLKCLLVFSEASVDKLEL